ncbi:MAG: fructose-1,6-bisphosphate aldolase/phosphatase [Patescibacteria group bacterium]
MNITLTLVKADIGSLGGHIKPSEKLLATVTDIIDSSYQSDNLLSYRVTHTGDDIAILMVHPHGVNNVHIHGLALEAFKAGTKIAKKQGLYGAGQDLLKDAFSGNIRGMGPAIAEMTFEERPNEPFLVFAADKTDPGAYNLPLYLGFADPMHCSGLLLSEKMGQGFKYTIMDVSHTEGDRVIELNTPEDLYLLAALLRDNERFVVETINSRATGEIAAVVSTTRLHNIAGKYTGKDDPIAIVRVQGAFPATGEILSPYTLGHFVAGFMRGSHNGPLMPVKQNSSISFFDGPPVVSCAAYCVKEGILTEAADTFDHPFWDYIRHQISQKALEIRRQGFSGPAMLDIRELEYGGIKNVLATLEERFKVR